MWTYFQIIGEELFGEIGESINFAKISSYQMKKVWTPPIFFQTKSLPNCDIFKTAKYNSHQHFLFYSNI